MDASLAELTVTCRLSVGNFPLHCQFFFLHGLTAASYAIDRPYNNGAVMPPPCSVQSQKKTLNPESPQDFLPLYVFPSRKQKYACFCHAWTIIRIYNFGAQILLLNRSPEIGDPRELIPRPQSLHKYHARINAGTPDRFTVTCPICLWKSEI